MKLTNVDNTQHHRSVQALTEQLRQMGARLQPRNGEVVVVLDGTEWSLPLDVLSIAVQGKRLNARVRQARVGVGLGLRKAAEWLGMSAVELGRIERGDTSLTEKQAVEMEYQYARWSVVARKEG